MCASSIGAGNQKEPRTFSRNRYLACASNSHGKNPRGNHWVTVTVRGNVIHTNRRNAMNGQAYDFLTPL
ncbi:hypothetical protein PISMIDRAFT_685386 [Pisolithus microcarpus 441]|uniref:Uncharacterized protein n=1 Tax=Pisolithus microcarpus 441 TaxID=765257 RepID=A0A0C9ZBP9_9AGAM|nr:hypothetical protein BKA83DRAFT_685386 [Pisolithus microcarpus]KIK17353.1 hypothetical protein PISMIDRAFT_685386 [Pisolithus microcarpus 441]